MPFESIAVTRRQDGIRWDRHAALRTAPSRVLRVLVLNAGAGECDAKGQIAIVVDHASRWYTAHLLLYVGMLLFVPGFLGLSGLTARLKPVQGYVARILIMIGTAGFASVITGEMLASRLLLDGVGNAATISLWTNLFMGPVAAAVGPALLAFFVGTFMFAIPLLRGSERLRRPVALIVIGALFVLAEILTARVLFSQIGNVVVLFGSAEAAWLIARDRTDGSELISRSAIT